MADPNAQNALGNLKVLLSQFLLMAMWYASGPVGDTIHFVLQEFATFLRVLGSYPTDVSEA
jgi:hypothetical protein